MRETFLIWLPLRIALFSCHQTFVETCWITLRTTESASQPTPAGQLNGVNACAMADARRPASELTRATNHALMAGVSLAGRRRAAGAPIGGRAGGRARTVAGSGGAAIDTDRGGRRHAAAVLEYIMKPQCGVC